MQNLITPNWEDYELLDTGDRQRLERFGSFLVVRPEPSALWEKSDPTHSGWVKPDAFFTDEKERPWELAFKEMAGGWHITWKGIKFKIRPTAFRHMGIFPEQAIHWEWIQTKVEEFQKKHGRPAKVLNLFGYTGGASLAAAKVGATVCHVDASKNTVHWASENAQLNGIEARWIVDDAMKFMEREARRDQVYDLIIMDPPVFGRGPKGEIWRLEKNLAHLAEAADALLSKEAAGILVNFYATDLYPYAVYRIFQKALAKRFPSLALSTLSLQESSKASLLQTGYSIRS